MESYIMKDSIKLSKKYGVNPTIPVCFFCGEPKNEVALMGKVKDIDGNEVQMGMYTILDISPCDKCLEETKKNLDNGYYIIYEVSDNPIKDFGKEDGQGIINVNKRSEGFKDASFYFTSRTVYLKEDKALEIIKDQPLDKKEHSKEKRVIYMFHDAFEAYFGEHLKAFQEEKEKEDGKNS